MGTLLDSTPEVPDEKNLKCFLVWWLLSKWDSLTNHWQWMTASHILLYHNN
jgi:hypothetical protein